MASSSMNDMSSSRVFDTLLRHFGGIANETQDDLEPNIITVDPISDFRIMPKRVSRGSSMADAASSITEPIDYKSGLDRTSTKVLSGKSFHPVSSLTSALLDRRGPKAECSYSATTATSSSNNNYNYNARTMSPSCMDVVSLSASISSGMISKDHSSLSSNAFTSHSKNSAPLATRANWGKSGIVSSNAATMCSPTSISIGSNSETSMETNGSHASNWSQALVNSSPTLPFNGNDDPMSSSNFGFSNSNMVGSWSDSSAMLLDDLASSVERDGPLSKKARKKQQDAAKPKRPLSAYNIFFREERQRILDALPQEILKQDAKDESMRTSSGSRRRKQLSAKEILHRKVDFHRLAKMVGRRWRELGPSEMEQYKSIANQDLQRYKKEMHAYKASMLIQEMGDQAAKQVAQNSNNFLFEGFSAQPEAFSFQPTAA